MRRGSTPYSKCPGHKGRAANILNGKEIMSGARLLPGDENLEIRLNNAFPFMGIYGEKAMATLRLETDRLILRKFENKDMEALYLLLKDEEVNTFLPWFPVKNLEETKDFYEKRFAGREYCFAICLKEDNCLIGYVKADTDDSYDLGYALHKEFWHKGIVAEASKALIEQLKQDNIPYVTATHDINNPRSGGVMRQIGMKYCYSYEELWQPKNFLVTFRMFQLNLDGQEDRIYTKYRDLYDIHFVERYI